MKTRSFNNYSPRGKFIVILSCILLLMLACSFPSRLSAMLATATPEPEITPTSPATPNTLESSQPTATGIANCYLGTWKIGDLSDYITPILTAHKIQGITPGGSTGSLILTFTQDGRFTLLSDGYHSFYNAQLGILPIKIDVAIEGSGSGEFQVDKFGNLLITNPDFSQITASASAASITVFPATNFNDLVPALGNDLAGKTVSTGSTCNGNSLTFDTGTGGAPPLIFTRATP